MTIIWTSESFVEFTVSIDKVAKNVGLNLTRTDGVFCLFGIKSGDKYAINIHYADIYYKTMQINPSVGLAHARQ